jgi:hypothetical protein
MSFASCIFGLILTPTTALSGWERWQGRNMSPGSRAWLGLYGETIFWCALVSLLAGVLALLIRQRCLQRSRVRGEFEDMCRQRGLSDEEQELLKLLADLSGVGSPAMIFTLKPEFERGVSTLLGSPRIANMSDNGRACMAQLLNFLREKLSFNHLRGSESDIISHTRQIPEHSLLSLNPPGALEPVDANLLRSDPFELVLEVQRPLDARPGDPLLARYCDGGSVWEFNTDVIRQAENQIHLKHSDSLRFINRRSFPRIPVRHPAMIATFPFDLRDRQDVLPKFEPAQLVELAGVGLKFESTVAVPQDQRALVILRLGAGKTVQSLAKIHRCSVLADHQWMVVAEMIGLSSSSISDLTRLTNQAAIEFRKSGPSEPAAMRPARTSREASHA